MPRHPEDVDPPALCVGCGKDGGEDDSPLECDKVRHASPIIYCCFLILTFHKCDAPWHLQCLNPPLDSVPDGEWFCPDCEDDPGAPVGKWAIQKKKPKPKARKTGAADDGDGDAGGKRKAPPKTKAGGWSTVPLLPPFLSHSFPASFARL
jgi:hypothetical protein